MKALIVGSGNFSENALKLLDDKTYIICADGGYDHAISHGIVPDILLGDLDSLKGKTDVKTIIYPKEKNETDSEIALLYAISKGYRDIVMTGVTGTRLDHTLGNIFLLKKAADMRAKAVIADDNNEIYYVRDSIRLCGEKGEFFSVVPLCQSVLVSINGAKYPLDRETLEFGTSRGISNEFLGKECEVTVHEGSALIIKSKD